MSNRSILMQAETLRTAAFGAVTASYTALGSGLAHPSHIWHIQNLTDANIIVSFDGVNDHEIVASGGFVLLDISSNMTRSEGFFFPKGMITYIKREAGAPSSGNVYLSSYYGTDR